MIASPSLRFEKGFTIAFGALGASPGEGVAEATAGGACEALASEGAGARRGLTGGILISISGWLKPSP